MENKKDPPSFSSPRDKELIELSHTFWRQDNEDEEHKLFFQGKCNQKTLVSKKLELLIRCAQILIICFVCTCIT